MQSKAEQCKAKESNAKQCKAKQSNAKQSKAKQCKAFVAFWTFLTFFDIFDIWHLTFDMARNQALEAQGTRGGAHPQGTRPSDTPGQPTGLFVIQLEPLIGKPNWGITYANYSGDVQNI